MLSVSVLCGSEPGAFRALLLLTVLCVSEPGAFGALLSVSVLCGSEPGLSSSSLTVIDRRLICTPSLAGGVDLWNRAGN